MQLQDKSREGAYIVPVRCSTRQNKRRCKCEQFKVEADWGEREGVWVWDGGWGWGKYCSDMIIWSVQDWIKCVNSLE